MFVLFYQRLVQGFCRMDVPPSGMDFLTRFLAPCCDIHIASTLELRPNQGLGPFAYARRYEEACNTEKHSLESLMGFCLLFLVERLPPSLLRAQAIVFGVRSQAQRENRMRPFSSPSPPLVARG